MATLVVVFVFGAMIAQMFGLVEYGKEYNYLMLAIAAIALGYGGDILQNGYKNLVNLMPNMYSLVGIGALVCFGYSLWGMIKGGEHLYFETVIMVIYFVKLGKFIEGKAKDKTKEAIAGLVLITPDVALVKKGSREFRVTLDEVKKGDVLVVRAGEKVAVDGVVIVGKAHFDEAFVSGESMPVLKEIGDKLLAGSINYDGYVEYEAQKIGRESTVSEIVQMVAKGMGAKPKIAQIADVVAGKFVPAVMWLAGVALVGNLVLGQKLEDSLLRMVSVLVVACPCALGLATPLAVMVAFGRSIKNGVVIKEGKIWEKIGKIDAMFFDKTGTLTYGRPKIAKFYNYSKMTDEKILQKAATLEKLSKHPLAKAFEDIKAEAKVEYFEEIVGLGLRGKVEGRDVLVGNKKLMKKFGIEVEERKEDLIFVAIDGNTVAGVEVCDVVRKEAAEVISEIKKRDIDIYMLTGDNIKTAEKVAKEVGLENVWAGLAPKDKVKFVQKVKKNKQCVAMCGDGINDGPVLVESDVAFGVGEGAEIAINVADVVLVKGGLAKVLWLIDFGKKVMKIIRQNLFWAFAYNVLMIPLAAGAFASLGLELNPMMACAAMMLSSLTVVVNSLRLGLDK